jgi:hypothetical protein
VAVIVVIERHRESRTIRRLLCSEKLLQGHDDPHIGKRL